LTFKGEGGDGVGVGGGGGGGGGAPRVSNHNGFHLTEIMNYVMLTNKMLFSN